jgi:DNA-binding CsgD family transcriptional regulator
MSVILVERSGELAALLNSLADCHRGAGSVTLISGSVGSGKTALLNRFAERAIESGALLLQANGSRAERRFPLGVVGQLFRSGALPREQVHRLRGLDGTSAIGDDPAAGDEEDATLATATLVGELCLPVLRLTERSPVVITVDDVQYVDPASMQVLLCLVRRSSLLPLMVVLTRGTGPEAELAAVNAEIAAHTRASRLRLGPLSSPGVNTVLAEHLGAERADELTAECHEVTGGNPLLLHALVEDNLATTDPIPRQRRGRAVVDDAYREAVQVCVRRCEPAVLHAARGLAVLDSAAGPALLGRLIDVEGSLADTAVQVLEAAGLVADGRFANTVARLAVLDDMPGGERSALFLRAAELLRAEGAPPTVIAGHLLASGRACPSWGLPVLCAAADQALAEDRTAAALEQLRLAERSCTDPASRAAIDVALAQVEWRVNPAAAMVRLPQMLSAFADGHLSAADVIFPINYLLWHGRFDEAVPAIELLPSRTDEQTRPFVHAFHLCLAASYPTMLTHVPHDPVRLADATAAQDAVTMDGRLRAPATFAAVLRFGPRGHVVTEAERVLQGCRLDHTTVQALQLAVLTLVYADDQEKAAHWCDLLLAEVATRQAPSWHGTFAAMRAEIALRQGDLPAAEAHAKSAFSLISEHGWGVTIGAPLGTLVHAATATGNHDEAAKALTVPVPRTMLRTRWGLRYLHARGVHRLAADQLQAALSDFLTCGELMAEWNIDLPALVPWRSEAAHVYVRLGQDAQARKLAKAQLDRPGAQRSRTHGISLRALAACSELRRRPHLLKKAAEELHAAGDKFELARALADLGETYHLLGDTERARMTVRRALHIARECHSASLSDRLAPEWMDQPADPAPDPDGTEAELTTLSDAERRVASLAAMGHTNREIARKLYITVSTVEQHLTRVYRKLNVHRRSDLPLQPSAL